MFEELQSKGIFKYFKHNHWAVSSSKKTIKILSPRTQKSIGEVQALTKKEIDAAIHDCETVQPAWNSLPLQERAFYLQKIAYHLEVHKKTIVEWLMKEVGKPQKDADDEVQRTIFILRETAAEGLRVREEVLHGDAFPTFKKGKTALVHRVPHGVVLAIAPFNYPVNLAFSKLAPAIIAGNTVLLKAPTQGAITLLHCAELFHASGLPAGVINVVTGDSAEIGDYLAQHQKINMIAFTGSTKVGKKIATLAGMKPLLMELGGKDAAIVLEDADLELAAKEIVSGAFSYAGQRCTAIKRVIVVKAVADKLAKQMVKVTEKIKTGLDQDALVCPLINRQAANYVQELVDDAQKKGAKFLTKKTRKDNLWHPLIIDNVTEKCRIAWEEQFGPVLPIIRVSSAEDAIILTNKSEYGLSASIFTKNIEKGLKLAEQLNVGTVQLNAKPARGPDHFPFTGVKNSGLGTQGIRYALEAMTRIKTVVLNSSQK